MNVVMLADIGSTYTKVTAVDMEEEAILGTAKAFTTVETNIYDGLSNAITLLREQTGNFVARETYACSSAAGGLKMIAVGLVPDLTAEAAKRAALSAGAKVLKTYSYELSDTEAREIQGLKPDILLLSGGTDGGNKEVILHNAGILSLIYGDFPIVVAGNKSVAGKVAETLQKAEKDVRICANVMPEFNVLNIEPAREIIRSVFLERIIRAKGLTKVEENIDGILMPTPAAVLNAVKLISTGYGEETGLGELLAVDVGGATTDVYSITEGEPSKTGVILKGLPESFAKRTVEGDLGVRYSAPALVEAAGIQAVSGVAGLPKEQTEQLLGMLGKNPGVLSTEEPRIGSLDQGLAAMAVKLAVERHVGRIEVSYTPMGAAYVQTGKDLTEVRKVIGTGGPVINSPNAGRILEQVLYSTDNPSLLKPQKVDMLLDRKYILAAMGLLGEKYPELAVKIMKKELELITWES
jgi:uncharacterized protein (TIGR01319 family)